MFDEPLNKGLIAVTEKSEITATIHQKRTKKSFSGAYFSEWLPRLEAIGRCFASGEAGYFPYTIVNGHIDEIAVRAI